MGVLRIRNPHSVVRDSYFLEHKTLNVRVAKGPGQPLACRLLRWTRRSSSPRESTLCRLFQRVP